MTKGNNSKSYPRKEAEFAQENTLAIVIPAYKETFIERTLSSIAAQENQNFRLYVADDNSPDLLGRIVEKFRSQFGSRLVYHRFENNLGETSLVGHWHRAIALSREKWVWLFSDDDMMSPDCVSAFHGALRETGAGYDLYRFNTTMINQRDKVVALNPPHPEWESWSQFAYFLLRQLRMANQQELVFRRQAYERVGGFLDLPLAWGSDHSFTITCGTRTGINTMRKGRILFRQSGVNFSSLRSRETDRMKMRAAVEFTVWFLDYIKQNACDDFIDHSTLEFLARERFLRSLRIHIRSIPLRDWGTVLNFMRDRLRIPKNEIYLRLFNYWIRDNVQRMRQVISFFGGVGNGKSQMTGKSPTRLER